MKLTKAVVRNLKREPEIVELLLKLNLNGSNFIYFQFDAKNNKHILGLAKAIRTDRYDFSKVLYRDRKASDITWHSLSFLASRGFLQQYKDFLREYYALPGEWFTDEIELRIRGDLGRSKIRFAGNPKMRKILRKILKNLNKYKPSDLEEEAGCL